MEKEHKLKRFNFLVFLIVTVLAVLIRFVLRDCLSNDMINCLMKWYDEIKLQGGIHALETQVGDYNLLYQFIVAVITYIPIKSVYSYKIISCIFDFLMALSLAFIIKKVTKNTWYSIVGYTCVLFSPVVWMNSALWGQCDAIYTFFIMLMLLFLINEKYSMAFFAFGLSISFKLQAIFVLPVLLFVYVYKRRFSIFNFLIIPATLVLSGLPCIISGRSIKDVFTVYWMQTGRYEEMAMGYPSFWNLFNDISYSAELFVPLKYASLIFTVVVLGMLVGYCFNSHIAINSKTLIYMTFIFAYTCVLFLPCMHERYGYSYELLAILVAFMNRKTILPLMMLNIMSIITYGRYLVGFEVNFFILSFVNVAVYAAYVGILYFDLKKRGDVICGTKTLYNNSLL